MADLFDILINRSDVWLPLLTRHIELSTVALIFSALIGVSVGALLTRYESAAFAVVSFANLGRTIPSLAILALAYPLVGTGFAPALIALVALGIPPILLGTYTGIREVDEHVRDAARGMGLTSRQRLASVELPIAAPMIMGGIRTGAVQIVASATLAALIGGGGLGEMILGGLTNLRYDLLLAGSVLVGLLALATELGCSLIERRVLPLGIRMLHSRENTRSGYAAGRAMSPQRWLAFGAVVLAGGGGFVVAGTGATQMVNAAAGQSQAKVTAGRPQVIVGSKDFTESILIAEMYAQALEAQGFPVRRRLNLGATAVADAALSSRDIHLYPEYTGTALTAVLKQKVPAAAKQALTDPIYAQVQTGYRSRGMDVMEQSPFSNGNAIVVTRATARRLNITTISDLAKVSKSLQFGAIPGFDTREDGLPLLRAKYGLEFRGIKTYEIGLKYKALSGGKVDAVYGFETDGQIHRQNFVVLRDDRKVWPPYHVVPVVDSKTVRAAGPDLESTLNSVTRLLDSRTMQRLNDSVDGDKKDPEDVAQAFLRKHKLG